MTQLTSRILPPAPGLRQCSGAFATAASSHRAIERRRTAPVQDARARHHTARRFARILGFFLLTASALHADDWPQWLGPQRDGVWRETGILEKFPTNGLKYRWRSPIGGGYSGPAVAGGRVFVMDRQLAKGAANPSSPWGRGEIPGNERVLCLNEADGKILWQHEYDCPYTVSYASGPRVTPAVHDGKVYTLGAEGNLLCLDVFSVHRVRWWGGESSASGSP